MRKRHKLSEFKAAAKAGTAPDVDAMLVKGFAVEEKLVGDDERTLQFVISTGAVDRDGDTIDPSGWVLDQYTKNPVVLFGHDSSEPPIATAIATWVEGGKLKSRAKFPTAEEHAFGNMIYRLYAGGYMKATSVGFAPKEYKINEERPGSMWGPCMDFLKQELLEYSAVSIPANPEALLEAGTKGGMDLRPMLAWYERALDLGSNMAEKAELEIVQKVLRSACGAERTTVMIERAAADIIAKIDGATDPVAQPVTPPAAAIATEAKAPSLADGLDALISTAKQGRVLSAANETRLAQARDLLVEVLSQVAEADEAASYEVDGSLEELAASVRNMITEALSDDDEEIELDLTEDQLRELVEAQVALYLQESRQNAEQPGGL